MLDLHSVWFAVAILKVFLGVGALLDLPHLHAHAAVARTHAHTHLNRVAL